MNRTLRLLTVAGVLLSLVAFVMACSDDDKKPTTPDTTAPAAISTLTTGAVTSNSVVLSWTSPGDDNATGTARQYDIRYSTAEITAGNFAVATPVTGEPTPLVAGSTQSMTVSGLFANTLYYFAMKTADEVPNWSVLSNCPHATTAVSTDTTPPGAIANLATGAVTATSIVLTWTAPGDDGTTGTAHQYDIRYSTATITDGNFAAATPVTGEPAPVAAGGAQTMTVTGLSASTPYYFAMKASDEVPNWSALSNVPTGTTSNVADTTPPAAVANLAGNASTSTEVDLTWTAPGDDASTGTAHEYDIRYSTSTITEGNFASATQVNDEPTPSAAGTAQGMAVTGLIADTQYYFAMKTEDEASNNSAISNVAQVHTPVAQDSPPGLTSPDFPDTVCITSTDQYAVTAKSMVELQLLLVNAYASIVEGFLAPMQNANWDHSGDCWDYSYGFSGCTALYHVCLTGTEYNYNLTYDGSCFGQSYDNWVAFQSIVDYSARTGTFRLYDENATTVAISWVWTWAADNNSGNYTFYEGEPGVAPVSASVDWARSADLNTYDLTFIQPEIDRVVTHVVKDPCSGLLDYYQWDSTGSVWWKQYEIAWNPDGSGYWDTYDDVGTVIEHHAW